jgi:hypothetical protein
MNDDEREAKTVEGPSGPPPDENLAYDPEMTDTDEANVPQESEADPTGSPPDPPTH